MGSRWVLGFFAVFALSARAQLLPNSKALEPLEQGTRDARALSADKKFEEAETLIQNLRKSYPQHVKNIELGILQGDIVKAREGCPKALPIYERMLGYRTTRFLKRYEREQRGLLSKRIGLCTSELKAAATNPEGAAPR